MFTIVKAIFGGLFKFLALDRLFRKRTVVWRKLSSEEGLEGGDFWIEGNKDPNHLDASSLIKMRRAGDMSTVLLTLNAIKATEEYPDLFNDGLFWRPEIVKIPRGQA